MSFIILCNHYQEAFNYYDNALGKFGGNVSIHKEYESLKNDFALICILPRESLRGLIRLNLLGVDWTSFLFLEICCHLALNMTSPLSNFRS